MTLPQPPRAEPRPLVHERFGVSWPDDWAWLRDPAYPEVRDPAIRAYLEAENGYFDAVMAPHEALVEALHAELKGRLKEDDASVPVRDGAFDYHWSFASGSQYRAWYRRALEAAEPELVLDENLLAEGKSFFNLRSLAPSPDGRLAAYTTDEDGSERYWLAVRDLAAGIQLEHQVGNTSGACVWAADSRTLFYVELNDSLRPFRVRAHHLGEAQAEDRIVYEEADPAFFVSLGKTRDDRFVIIGTGTHVTTELMVVPADRPDAAPRIVAARREGHRYGLDHAHGRFWITTNDVHENFRLVSAPAGDPVEANWQEVLPGSEHRYLLRVDCFADFLVLSERVDGLADIRVRTYDGHEHVLDFPEKVCTVAVGDNRTFATDRLRVHYTSMISPPSVIDCVVGTGELVVRKVQEIPSGYDKSRYVTRRLMARAPDGVEVPVTVVHRDDFPADGSGRLFLYGYAAYGMGNDPAFNPHRLSLLDRGFCFAYAHARGGDEMGWRWYRDGKLEKKENSFSDFIACAEALIEEGYARPGAIAIRGGSAGGMLMGAVANRRPELWRCVVADVPFVDVLNTMLDASLPLTPIEWPEWGDPLNDEAAFRRILSYSPYDNIRPQAYPPMLVTAGISDSRVTYWEPAKFVARLRATKADDNLLLLRTNMDAGHFGKSGRFDALRELAEQYVFVFRCFGML
ncbi:S9 family peptidase [Geminicoccaceae bacterium 1502E]|nr:S9 family peptidase [Geminicoccaceae bacterium 1502E]